MGYGHEPVGPDGLGHEPGAARRRGPRLRARLPHGVSPGRRRPDHAGRLLRPPVRHRDVRDPVRPRREPGDTPPLVDGAQLRSGAGPRAELLPADRDRVALRLHVRPADRVARRADPLRHRPLRPDHLLRSDDADDRQHPAPHLDPADARLLAGPDPRHARRESGRQRHAYPLGFGMGWQLNRIVDLRTWFLFPDISRNAAARWWGIGVALEVRFE